MWAKWTLRAAGIIMTLALSACAGNSVRRTSGMLSALPPPSAAAVAGTTATDAAYRLGAQDLLTITVFGVPDLSRDVRISSNGMISLPLIGAVQAAGKTVAELEHDIAERLAKKYLQNPQVTVFVKEFTSQRVTLEGALKKPGIYPLTGETTLLQAVALAGGLDPLAERDGVVVFRQVNGRKMAAVFNLEKISVGQAVDPRVYGDDIIVVATSGSKSAVHQLIQSAPILALFFLL